jgi:hypothetical protein
MHSHAEAWERKKYLDFFESKAKWQRHLAAGFQRLEASVKLYKDTSMGTRKTRELVLARNPSPITQQLPPEDIQRSHGKDAFVH